MLAGRVVREISLQGKNRNVGSWLVAFSEDGSLIASVVDAQTIYLWDAVTGKEVRHFEEIFRQGEQPPSGSAEGQEQQGENAQQADKLAELQKAEAK